MSNLLLLITIVLLGSAGGISVKIGLESFSPFLFTFLRFFLSFLIIFPLLKKHDLFNLRKRKKLYVVSIFAVLNVLLFAFGIKLSTIITSSIIYTLIPVVVGVISHFFLHNRYKRNEIIGALIGLLGALFVVFLPVIEHKQSVGGSLQGNLLLSMAMLSFALYGIFSKPLQNKVQKKEITAAFFLLAWSTQIILLAGELMKHNDLLVAPLTARSVGGLLFSASLGTAGFYILYQRLIARAGPLYASFSFYLNPIVSALMAMIFLGEKLSVNLFAGAAITFLGVWLYSKK